MPSYTSNYKLTKPFSTELYDIYVPNDNMDTIDSVLNAHDVRMNSNFNFATEETLVGVWIDGKPIYRRIVEFGAIAAGAKHIIPFNLGDATIDKVVSLRGMARLDVYDGTWLSLPYADTNSDWTMPLTLYGAGRTTPEFTIYANKLYAITGGYVLVEYTKK